jgi:hypothetical protein
MSESLRSQLESLGDKIPIVHQRHYVMFNKTADGPVAFLMEQTAGDTPILKMEMSVKPVFSQYIVPAKGGSVKAVTKRKRYTFKYRDPKRKRNFPVKQGETPSCDKWLRVNDELYHKLLAHDSEAWEDVLGFILDVPTRKDDSFKKDSRSGGKG